MKTLLLALVLTTPAFAQSLDISEVVYVETTLDTDSDGVKDRIYVSINRPNTTDKLASILEVSPYSLGGTEVPMHNVDLQELPQDTMLDMVKSWESSSEMKSHVAVESAPADLRYANISAHSIGTGYSTGCPTVGDEAEALAAKSVIDWLNGRARAFDRNNKEVSATAWSTGNVGMTGISYNGTLPIMVAATGVEGLKAIVPIAAISNWYDYYRANGLVVNPGGYIGEDADILGYYIVRKNACTSEMQALTRTQGREHGDFSPFWQVRNHLANADKIKAATFIIHGQSDWNVKQKHAIQLWEALEGVVPRRMFLHRGGHGSTGSHRVPGKIKDWFDHFLYGVENGITNGPQVEVELFNGSLMVQNQWPSEATTRTRLYFNAGESLVTAPGVAIVEEFEDNGKNTRLESLRSTARLSYLSAPLTKETVLSGTAMVQLKLAVMNRAAANVTVAIVSVDSFGRNTIITRGWADPQNYADLTTGEKLVPGKFYNLRFPLEPKQAKIAAGNRIGIMVASTDYEYTLRPAAGTRLQLSLGSESFIELDI